MNPDRWNRIDKIFQNILELPPQERTSFLDKACEGDSSLRGEVLGLVRAHEEQGEFLASLAQAAASGTLAGQTLGRYQVTDLVGVGGMGAVYRAWDTKLKRDVAIKVLPEPFSQDGDRVLRFQREAESLAALNHPHIAAIHAVEEIQGSRFLVLELVEGETLADRIERGPIPLLEALQIARQIAEALEAAHEKGIVHRDLKPGNIKITPEGRVKVLDFGLAKVTQASATGVLSDTSASLAQSITTPGMLLGTASYMAPEQAQGKTVDRRGDIWAFGTVLYEMLTGRRLFTGNSTAEILAAVLTQKIDLRQVPPNARRLLGLCLERDPNRRLRHIGDMELLLEEESAALRDGAVAATGQTAHGRMAKVGWIVAAFAMAAVGILLFVPFRDGPTAPAEIVRREVHQPPGVLFTNLFSVSPDGRHLAFIAATNGVYELWLQPIGSFEARPIPGTKGLSGPPHGAPIWSSDSRSLVYWRHTGVAGGGKLYKTDIAGGPQQSVADVPFIVGEGFWTSQDRLVFGGADPSGGLSEVSARGGGKVTPLTVLADGEFRHAFPSLLPDGVHFLYSRLTGPEPGSVYVGSLDVAPEEQSVTPLVAGARAAAYVPKSADRPNEGHLLFVREGTLFSQPFDPVRRVLLPGEPRTVAPFIASADLITSGGVLRPPGFSASPAQVLVYRTRFVEGSHLTLYDRQGNIVKTVGDPGAYAQVAFSPKGDRLAAVRGEGPATGYDIWSFELTGNGRSQKLTFDPFGEIWPLFSPNGDRIAFGASQSQGTQTDIYQKSIHSSESQREFLCGNKMMERPTSWSDDGRFLLIWASGDPTPGIWVCSIGERQPRFLMRGNFGSFSPDGKWIVYMSNKSGRAEIYATPFDLSAKPGDLPEWQVSQGGSNSPPFWRGEEIFYRNLEGDVISVDVTIVEGASRSLKFGDAQPLFKTDAGIGFWSVSYDGQHFVLPVPATEAGLAVYKIVLNWTAMLE